MRYHDLLRANAALVTSEGPRVRIALLSNATIAPLREVLEYSLRSRGVNAVVELGDYDNVGRDSIKARDCDAVVIFYELANIVDNLPFTLHDVDESRCQALIDKAKAELGVVFGALASTKVVILNLLTAIPFTIDARATGVLETICDSVNAFIRDNAPKSFRLVDLGKVFARCSVKQSIDLRFFISSRSLYKYAFLRAYAEHVFPVIGVAAGVYMKVLVLDCDNTLWRGIVGEDGQDGIRVFVEVQSVVVSLAKAGVIVCLCSKNNPEDVDAVLRAHPAMVLRDEHVVVKAVNWNDKSGNLRLIAETLNVGLESFVFLDDSDFEVASVRQELPEVTTIKVPSDYAEFLWCIQAVAGLFYREGTTLEDRSKATQYRDEFVRKDARALFQGEDAFLASLCLRLRLSVDSTPLVPRLAQLTQKTNQFNLTTHRMAEADVDAWTRSSDHLVVGLDLSDKFGDYGTTGLVALRLNGHVGIIENFLLSCRILGRGVELKAFDALVVLLRHRGVRSIVGTYRPTKKNGQVRLLYERMGFLLAKDDQGVLEFHLDADTYRASGVEYIEVEVNDAQSAVTAAGAEDA